MRVASWTWRSPFPRYIHPTLLTANVVKTTMATLQQTAIHYQTIVDNVIEALRLQFENAGKDAAILETLRKTWMAKFNEAGVLGHHKLPFVAAGAPQQIVGATHPSQSTLFMQNQYVQRPQVPVPGHLHQMVHNNQIGVIGPNAAAYIQNMPQRVATTAHPSAQLPQIPVQTKTPGLLVPQAAMQTQNIQQLGAQQLSQPSAAVKEEKKRSRALDDEELGSDDDDDDLNVDLGEDDPDQTPKNSIICLFEKVTRVKNKRRVQLRDGLMKIAGKEYIFSRCNGEFDW